MVEVLVFHPAPPDSHDGSSQQYTDEASAYHGFPLFLKLFAILCLVGDYQGQHTDRQQTVRDIVGRIVFQDLKDRHSRPIDIGKTGLTIHQTVVEQGNCDNGVEQGTPFSVA